jgi:AraC-like DNA-binding protein
MRSRLDLVKNWEQRAKDAGYSASKMARTLGVTVRLLQSFFQARLRISPHEWMLRKRMYHAVALLKAGSPVKIVASQLEYKNASHFSREFKRFFGKSPQEFAFEPVASDLSDPVISRFDRTFRI